MLFSSSAKANALSFQRCKLGHIKQCNKIKQNGTPIQFTFRRARGEKITVFTRLSGKSSFKLLFETISEDQNTKSPGVPPAGVLDTSNNNQNDTSLPVPALFTNQQDLVRGELPVQLRDNGSTVYCMPAVGYVRGELYLLDEDEYRT